jgi:nucleoside-diphosphate-sugar epimerase
MKILVLGGTGTMGKNLVSLLANQNHQVTVTTRQHRVASEANIHYVTGNGKELVFLKNLLHNSYDVIIDFLSYSSKEFNQRYKLF